MEKALLLAVSIEVHKKNNMKVCYRAMQMTKYYMHNAEGITH